MKYRFSVPIAVLTLMLGCSSEEPSYDELWESTLSRVSTRTYERQGRDGTTVSVQQPFFRDAKGRYVHFKGINVSGSHKAPPTEEFPSLYPLPQDPELRERCTTTFPMPRECIPAKKVSYIGRPFPVDEIDRWYATLAELGFNSVRLITNWESIQPFQVGECEGEQYSEECFDQDYLAYYELLVERAKAHGIYVLIDMHQDIFSRYLVNYYNEEPDYVFLGETKTPAEGSLDHFVLSLFPPFTDWVRGHGAPRWVVETALPEKNLDSEYWGYFRGAGGMVTELGTPNLDFFGPLQNLLDAFDPDGEDPEYLATLFQRLPDRPFEVYETSDLLPLNPWILSGLLSVDVDRSFASFFAGDVVFPDRVVDSNGCTRRAIEFEAGRNWSELGILAGRAKCQGAPPEGDQFEDLPDLRTYLQGRYIASFRKLAEIGSRHDNVIGYDVMNEPVGAFIMMAISGLFAQMSADDEAGEIQEGPIQSLLVSLLGEEVGADAWTVIDALRLLPLDGRAETLEKWGMTGIDAGAALGINFGFEETYLQPFYERVGQAIQAVDENAIIWFEPATSIRLLTGPMQFFDQPLTKPQGIDQLVYAPHWYPDIYPKPGTGSTPRDFNLDEWQYRDFRGALNKYIKEGPAWMGNIPVVFGEFGTYFNFGDPEQSRDNNYQISAHILNRYYEAFEDLNVGNMVWCFSAENDIFRGELWNHEDFSIIDENGEARAWPAYVRTTARATSGRLISQKFLSQYAYWDVRPDAADPEGTYTLKMRGSESGAPTEIFVPERVYSDGFYVWLSDGEAYFDEQRQMLYWYPFNRGPDTIHSIRIEPPRPNKEMLNWTYFFHEGTRVDGVKGANPEEASR